MILIVVSSRERISAAGHDEHEAGKRCSKSQNGGFISAVRGVFGGTSNTPLSDSLQHHHPIGYED